MAAKMDIDYTCNACGAKGGIHVEVEVDIVLLDLSPEDYKRPEPLGEIPYRPDDEGERPWERPDGVAERAEIEAIKHWERRARRIAMRRSKRNKRLLYRTMLTEKSTPGSTTVSGLHNRGAPRWWYFRERIRKTRQEEENKEGQKR
jgi:hypothetical protein